MKAYLYKFTPLLIFVIGLIIFYVFNDYPTLIHVIVIIAFITNGLKNVYFVNNNIRNHMIWVSPKLDRILGMISGILYFGIYVVGFIKQQPLWIVILILVSTVGTAVLLETKLHITSLQLEETLSSERIKRKVISRHKAQRLKCIFFYCDCCSNHFNAHIIIFKVDGYFWTCSNDFYLSINKCGYFRKILYYY